MSAKPTPSPEHVRKRAENHGSVILKARAFDADFRDLLTKAAMRAGKSQGQRAAEVLIREARRILTGGPEGEAAEALIDDISPHHVVPSASKSEPGAKLDTLAALIESLTAQPCLGLFDRLGER